MMTSSLSSAVASAAATPSPANTKNVSLSLATRYSLLRGRHISMEQIWNKRHSNAKKLINDLQNKNETLSHLLQLAQKQIKALKNTITSLTNKSTSSTEHPTDNPSDDELSNTDFNEEYNNLSNLRIRRSQRKEHLFYELLRECLFLSDPYNMRVIVKRMKQGLHTKPTPQSLHSSLLNIIQLRKSNDYSTDCYAIYHQILTKNEKPMDISVRLILMKNSMIISGTGLSNISCSNYFPTIKHIEFELYLIAGIYLCNHEPFEYCNTIIIACTNDLTIAAQGINPFQSLLSQKQGTDVSTEIMQYYMLTVFSDSSKLVQYLTERLPDHIWFIGCTTDDTSLLFVDQSVDIQLNTDMKESDSYLNRIKDGFVAGFTGVVMDPIRGGQKSGVKGFLRGIASGISGVAMKPIYSSFRSTVDGVDDGKQESSVNENESLHSRNMTFIVYGDEDMEDNVKHVHIPQSPFVPKIDISDSASVTSSVTNNTFDSSDTLMSSASPMTIGNSNPMYVQQILAQRQHNIHRGGMSLNKSRKGKGNIITSIIFPSSSVGRFIRGNVSESQSKSNKL